MEARSRRLAQLLLEGDLGAVTLGLEEGLFSWEELDLPHDSDGSTPLISACQMGLATIVRFLLERGVDMTLWNKKNQTALHVSPPDLQRELLAARVRPLGRQGQLLEASWKGDINTLQHLLAQTELEDVNIQNRNGWTPLMLAVRDVDLFEGLKEILPWDYRPTETVKALLALPVSTEVEDHKGCTALHYVSQIRSPIKEDLLQSFLELTSQTDRSTSSLNRSPPPSPSSPARLRNAVESPEDAAVQENQDFSPDKIITLFFQAAMEPKRKTRQGFTQLSKATSWTSSLPNLRDTPATLHCTSDDPIKSSLIPKPPRPPENLSQSAPSMALLDASVLLQVRTNIHNRLGRGEIDSFISRQKDAPPFQCPRTPKRLAPLDSGLRLNPVLSSLQRPLQLKPINISPASSAGRQRRERFYRHSLRRSTRGGSAESASSSCSSESSLDLDEEEEAREENGSLEKQQIFSTLQREPILGHLSSSKHLATVGTARSNNDVIPMIPQFKRSQEVQVRTSHDLVHDCEQNGEKDSAELDKVVQSVRSSSNDSEGHMDEGKDIRPAVENGESSFIVDLSPENNAVLLPTSVEKSKPTKTTKSKARKCRPFHTDQSFNILAYRNTNWGTVNPKKNKRTSTSSQVKSKDLNRIAIKAETTFKADWPRTAPTKSPQSPKPKDASVARKRTPEFPHQVRVGGDNNILNKCQSQKQLLNRELKTAGQPKKPENSGSQRSKSALDSVSYSDMFLQIHHGEKGPAIFEMFATPIFENLRVGSSAERAKQLQIGPQVKRLLNEPRVQKVGEGNRRKPPQKCKGKPRKRRDVHVPPIGPQNFNDEGKAVVSSDDDGTCHMKSHEILTSEDDKRKVCEIKDSGHGPMLSVIKEVLSNCATGTPSKRDSPTSSCSAIPLCRNGPTSNTPKDSWEISSKAEDLNKPMINKSGRTRSPVYQRFLDEVGEGPVTDDLLRCLAEELISLEEKEVETLKPEHTRSTDEQKCKKVLPEDTTSDDLTCNEKSSVDDTNITWTKGEVLGRGAYGTVYCGLTSQGQLIAVKQVVLDVSTSETAEKEHDRLQREVDLLKNLHHPNIVGFLGTALIDSVISIFMEYVPGGSLYSILSRFGPLPEKVFALYTRQILEGVAYLHDNRVIHRDLKGNNIMLMPTGIVKLIDFGCARRLSHLTHSGGNSDLLKSVHGTPYWMAPEVINETGHGRKSDIWSIGCTVFEMATGKPPLANMGKIAALFYIGARKGLMPSLPDDFSEEAKGFVKECLISNQEQRPSAADLLRHPFILDLRQPKSIKADLNPHLLPHQTNCP